MNLSFFIGLRYLFSKRKEGFLSLVSWFSFVGIILGVASLITVLSVMNGFHAELRERILSVVPHAHVVLDKQQASTWQDLSQQLKQQDYVLGVAPFIDGQAMLSKYGSSLGVKLTGIDPNIEQEVSVLDQHMQQGQLSALSTQEFGIVIGQLLARQLNVTVGDEIKVIVPKVTITPAGIFPRMREFKVVGVFSVGSQIDHEQAFINLKDAQTLYQVRQSALGLRLKFADVLKANQYTGDLISKNNLNQNNIKTWEQTHHSLFSAVKMEKTMVSLLLAVVIAVAAFNIISILSMMVLNKTKDIAVLRTMGASSREITWIFLIYGMSMAFLGMLIGTLIGLPLSYYAGEIVAFFESLLNMRLFDPSVYFISQIPSDIHVSDVVTVNVLTFVLVLLVCLVPAYQAAKIEPAQALQYE